MTAKQDEAVLPSAAEARRARKRAARLFTPETAPPALAAAEADQHWWPSRMDWQHWSEFLMPDLGVTPEGYWYGHCPLHDHPAAQADQPTMLISFWRGSMKCLSNSTTHCHEKRAISLTNALNKMNYYGEQ